MIFCIEGRNRFKHHQHHAQQDGAQQHDIKQFSVKAVRFEDDFEYPFTLFCSSGFLKFWKNQFILQIHLVKFVNTKLIIICELLFFVID